MQMPHNFTGDVLAWTTQRPWETFQTFLQKWFQACDLLLTFEKYLGAVVEIITDGPAVVERRATSRRHDGEESGGDGDDGSEGEGGGPESGTGAEDGGGGAREGPQQGGTALTQDVVNAMSEAARSSAASFVPLGDRVNPRPATSVEEHDQDPRPPQPTAAPPGTSGGATPSDGTSRTGSGAGPQKKKARTSGTAAGSRSRTPTSLTIGPGTSLFGAPTPSLICPGRSGCS